MHATPTLATGAGEPGARAGAGATGILHCSAASTSTARARRRAVAAFGLDPALVRSGTPPAPPSAPVPYDTRLDAAATFARLGVDPPGLDGQLARPRLELEESVWATT